MWGKREEIEMKPLDWMNDNRAIAIAAMVCVTLIVIAVIMRPPRYQKAGPNNSLILDTWTGKMLRMDGTLYQYPKKK